MKMDLASFGLGNTTNTNPIRTNNNNPTSTSTSSKFAGPPGSKQAV